MQHVNWKDPNCGAVRVRRNKVWSLPQGEYFLQRVSKDTRFASERSSASSRFIKISMFVALGSRLSKSKLPKWLDPDAQTIGSELPPCQIALLLFACGLILSHYRHSHNEKRMFTDKHRFIVYDPKKKKSSPSQALFTKSHTDSFWVTSWFLGPFTVDKIMHSCLIWCDRPILSGVWGSSLVDCQYSIR